MSAPPSYEESTSNEIDAPHEKSRSIVPTKPDIRSEIESSRTQHVLMVANSLAPRVRDRAKRGLSKSNFLLLPSANGQRPPGELVLSEGDSVDVIELQDALDTPEFWRQKQVLEAFAGQAQSAIAGDIPVVEQTQLPPRPAVATKRPWWARRAREPVDEMSQPPPPPPPPFQIIIKLDDVHFRTETPTGLMETVRADGIFVRVEFS